ncbi:MAG: cytochrome c maturation protein CcmE [Rhodomicrobiaceae bacterium]
MTRKQRRSVLIVGGLAALSVAAFLVLSALRNSIVFFYSPSDVAQQGIQPGHRFRLGGLVSTGSVKHLSGKDVEFEISDGNRSIEVSFSGLLPDLFREGQGVVAEGKLGPSGRFVADTVLAKHDEKYMPREVVDALKKQGRWQEREAKVGPAASRTQ